LGHLFGGRFVGEVTLHGEANGVGLRTAVIQRETGQSGGSRGSEVDRHEVALDDLVEERSQLCLRQQVAEAAAE